MSYDIKDFLKKFFSSRLFVLAAVFIVFFGIILARIFTLQVVNGKSYQENFSLKIQMKQPINAARGNIYDKKESFWLTMNLHIPFPSMTVQPIQAQKKKQGCQCRTCRDSYGFKE